MITCVPLAGTEIIFTSPPSNSTLSLHTDYSIMFGFGCGSIHIKATAFILYHQCQALPFIFQFDQGLVGPGMLAHVADGLLNH